VQNKDSTNKTHTISKKLPFDVRALVEEFIAPSNIKISSENSNKTSEQSENILLDAKNIVSGLPKSAITTDLQIHTSARTSSKSSNKEGQER
jgi:hypothetical protein